MFIFFVSIPHFHVLLLFFLQMKTMFCYLIRNIPRKFTSPNYVKLNVLRWSDSYEILLNVCCQLLVRYSVFLIIWTWCRNGTLFIIRVQCVCRILVLLPLNTIVYHCWLYPPDYIIIQNAYIFGNRHGPVVVTLYDIFPFCIFSIIFSFIYSYSSFSSYFLCTSISHLWFCRCYLEYIYSLYNYIIRTNIAYIVSSNSVYYLYT